MSGDRVVSTEEQALIDAQHARAYARESFYTEWARLSAALRQDAATIEEVMDSIRVESRHVSKTLNDVDQAVLDRVTAMLLDIQIKVEALDGEVRELRALVKAQIP